MRGPHAPQETPISPHANPSFVNRFKGGCDGRVVSHGSLIETALKLKG